MNEMLLLIKQNGMSTLFIINQSVDEFQDQVYLE